MKLLIINYEFPPIGGGAGNASFFISKELARLGHDILVLTSRYRSLPTFEIKDGFSIMRIPVRRSKIDSCTIFEMMTFLVSGLINTPKVMNQFKPDITLAFFTLPCAPIAYYLKCQWQVPYIVLLRGGDVPGFRGIGKLAQMAHTILLPFTRHLWNQSEHVVANSDGLALLAKSSWNGQIRVIPNGVDTSFFMPSRIRSDSGIIRLLFVGRLSTQKGLLQFFDVLRELQSTVAWELIVVGDGPLRATLEAVVRSSPVLLERVVFEGWVAKDYILSQYQRADILVHPSLDEGMPNAILEAMACGLPILASKVSGNVELVQQGRNGLLFDADKSDCLRSIETLIDDAEKRRDMRTWSRLLAEQRSWANVAIKLQFLTNGLE